MIAAVRPHRARPARGDAASFDALAAEHYEAIKDDVIAAVRGRLASDNVFPDAPDLEAVYNQAWAALLIHMRDGGEAVANLGGWLASIAHRRAVDDARAEMRHRARTAAYATVAAEHGVGAVSYTHLTLPTICSV